MCEEVSFRERLGSCAKRLSAADALPEAELRAVVREVHADLVGLDLPQRVLGAAHSAPGLAPPVPVGGGTPATVLALDHTALAADAVRSAEDPGIGAEAGAPPTTVANEMEAAATVSVAVDEFGDTLGSTEGTTKEKKKKKKRATGAARDPDPDDGILAEAIAVAEAERRDAGGDKIMPQIPNEALLSSGSPSARVSDAALVTFLEPVAVAPLDRGAVAVDGSVDTAHGSYMSTASGSAMATSTAARRTPGLGPAPAVGMPAIVIGSQATAPRGELTLESWLDFIGCPELLLRLRAERLDGPDFWLLLSTVRDSQLDGWPERFRQEAAIFRGISWDSPGPLTWEPFLRLREAVRPSNTTCCEP